MITAHGNFNPPALRISFWKKWLARQTFIRPVLEHASCYQALTETEYRTLRAFGIRQPICVIGNGIKMPDSRSSDGEEFAIPKALRQRRTCLYLGRLHPIKGLERLLSAWAEVNRGDDWQLILAGDGDSRYRDKLQALSREAGCRNVTFLGMVTGEIKSAWLRQAEFLVLTSHSEAFPMALLEGFAYGKAALITTGCGFPESATAGATVEVDGTSEAIRAGLQQMLALPSAELARMGHRAHTFAAEHYSWETIGEQLELVYAWLDNGGPPPDCVRVKD